MSEVVALIFDVDGTLADTERDGHRVAFNRAFADAGLDWEWDIDLYGKLLGVTGGKERIRHYLDRYNTDFDRPADLDGFIAGLHRAKTTHYTQLIADGDLPLRPGVRRLLEQARASGLRLGIATTTTPANVTALIENTLSADAMGWFEVIGAGDIVPSKKPAPDIYTWVMREMGVSPDQVLAFEDSGHGVTSAVGAGIECVVVTTNDYTRDQDFGAACVVMNHLGDPGNAALCLSGMAPPQGIVDLDYLVELPRAHRAASA
jgi:HAD superfamily hydrolase (TIGR01509 family)